MSLRQTVVFLAAGLAWSCPAACFAAEPVDVAFQARVDGSRERYVMIAPEGSGGGAKNDAKPTHLLIALHGHGSDRWQFVQSPRGECKAVRDVAAAHHMLFISPDYRAKTSWMGPKAEADLLQIIGELKAKRAIGKVILCGGSMGATSSLSFAAMHPTQIDGVVALNGTANHLEYENFQDAIRKSFGGTKAAIPAEYKKRSAEYWPERLSMPMALTTGGKDTSVPPESVLRLASVLKKIQPNVLLIHRPETGHETSYDDSKAALEFVVERVLGKN
jgi:pimeloyl-ACP methyl ester carboxylesterase